MNWEHKAVVEISGISLNQSTRELAKAINNNAEVLKEAVQKIEELSKEVERLKVLEVRKTPEEVVNYSVAVLAEVAECARQEDAPIYEGDKEVDRWVRLSDVEEAINKHLN